MKRLALAGAFLIAGLAAQAGSLPKNIVDRVAAACVLIQAVEGKEAHAGSGFFVGRNEVLTNYHVIKAAAEGNAKVVLVVGTDPKTRKLVNATVAAGDEEIDLALLKAEAPSTSILRFGADKALRLTQPIWVAGFPFGAQPGLELTLTTGTVTALRLDDAGALQQVQLDAAVNPGNSGGPVVDERGNVVGVSRAVIKPTVGSGMAMAIPGGVAQDFLKVAQRARQRAAKLQLQGKTAARGIRVAEAEKTEEVWGTAVRILVRATHASDEAISLQVEVTSRRHEVLAQETLDVGRLNAREEKGFTIRLRRIPFDDVITCKILGPAAPGQRATE